MGKPLLDLRMEERDDRVIFEVWREGEEEPIVKHEVIAKDSSACLDVRQALYDAVRKFEEVVIKQIDQKLFGK